jgi:hypothetical protein
MLNWRFDHVSVKRPVKLRIRNFLMGPIIETANVEWYVNGVRHGSKSAGHFG